MSFKAVRNLGNLIFVCPLFFCWSLNRTHIGNHKHKISINQNINCLISFIMNTIKLKSIDLPNVTREQSLWLGSLGYSWFKITFWIIGTKLIIIFLNGWILSFISTLLRLRIIPHTQIYILSHRKPNAIPQQIDN